MHGTSGSDILPDGKVIFSFESDMPKGRDMLALQALRKELSGVRGREILDFFCVWVYNRDNKE